LGPDFSRVEDFSVGDLQFKGKGFREKGLSEQDIHPHGVLFCQLLGPEDKGEIWRTQHGDDREVESEFFHEPVHRAAAALGKDLRRASGEERERNEGRGEEHSAHDNTPAPRPTYAWRRLHKKQQRRQASVGSAHLRERDGVLWRVGVTHPRRALQDVRLELVGAVVDALRRLCAGQRAVYP